VTQPPLRILLLAPQPFFQERGTPIAVKLLARGLCARGHQVDLLCYPEGQDIRIEGLRLVRSLRFPGAGNVRPGPSFKKILCDIGFACAAAWLAMRNRYHLVHAVEESAFVAMALKHARGLPYVYDMDSLMSEQLSHSVTRLFGAAALFRWLERRAIRSAEAVVPMCDALGDYARQVSARRVVVLRDISLLSEGASSELGPVSLGAAEGAAPVAMYVGNLEPYQGIDLLLDSFLIARRECPTAQGVIIGGRADAIAHYRDRVTRLGLAGAVHFLGPKPVDTLGAYLRRADILVSPRLSGENTPMKIYSYLDSGKAVLATDLPTHRQVMSEDHALLVAPEAAAFARGMVLLFQDAALRSRLALSAKNLIARRHSHQAYDQSLTELYAPLLDLARPRRPRPRFIPQGSLSRFALRLREAAAAVWLWMDGPWL
jgi:glycosyltransferase involved in cell wall biosynthesis